MNSCTSDRMRTFFPSTLCGWPSVPCGGVTHSHLPSFSSKPGAGINHKDYGGDLGRRKRLPAWLFARHWHRSGCRQFHRKDDRWPRRGCWRQFHSDRQGHLRRSDQDHQVADGSGVWRRSTRFGSQVNFFACLKPNCQSPSLTKASCPAKVES